MQYKRDHAGELLEISGCDSSSIDALKAIFANAFTNYDCVNRLKQIILPSTADLFISFECPLQQLKSEPDFDTIRICELCPAEANYVSGILSLTTKRCYARQGDSSTRRKLQLSCLLQQQSLQLDQARHQYLSCNDRVRRWLSTVSLESDQKELDGPGHEVALDTITDISSIFESSDEETKETCVSSAGKLTRLDFAEYYALIVLSQNGRVAPLRPSEKVQAQTCLDQDAHTVVDQITSLFDERLRSVAPEGDKWHLEGRKFFLGKIEFFVLGGATIEICLPAFPCKSSNFDKVASRSPDGAEYESLVCLFRFCNEVRQLYRPGCRITIVSDGHVFSDCIGVDDNRVSEYTSKLLRMAKSISSHFASMTGLGSPIIFKNLHNLFLDDRALSPLFHESYISTYELRHFLNTELNPQDEKCRKLLMLSAQSDANNIVACIRSRSENSLTPLFRGFSKFMLEDLARHPQTEHLSKSQRKKLSQKIALEMIFRNQAYSHLVEQIFPHFVRFSIHAHRNSGPKFGVKLLPSDRFKHLTSFSELDESDVLGVGDAESEQKHLHIPTPWHNSLLEIEGRRHSYICKAMVVRDELSSPESKWEGGYFPSPRGERWMVSPKSEKRQWKEKRDGKHSQMLADIEKGKKQAAQEEQYQLQEQLKKEHERELERTKSGMRSEVYDNIDLLIAQRAEISDSSTHSDDEEDSVLPEWMDESSECTSLSDFVLWRHVQGDSQATNWIQVPFSEVQKDRTVKGNSVRDMYASTHIYPEYPPMVIGNIRGLPFMGSNWLEIPQPVTERKLSPDRTAKKSSSKTTISSNRRGTWTDKNGNNYHCVEGRVITQPSPTKKVAEGRDIRSGMRDKEGEKAQGERWLNANASPFKPRHSKRSRSDTNPFEVGLNQLGPCKLEAAYETANAIYQRDIGTLSFVASSVKAGCRQEVGNGTTHSQEYVSQISMTAVREMRSTKGILVSG
jgi:pyoverdine/dityrosine biosynthesis protein Dit1